MTDVMVGKGEDGANMWSAIPVDDMWIGTGYTNLLIWFSDQRSVIEFFLPGTHTISYGSLQIYVETVKNFELSQKIIKLIQEGE